jgi:hypothetical protein
MKIRRPLSALLGIGLVAALAVTSVGETAMASADTDPTIAEGTVLSAAGEPVADALIVARTEQRQGDRTMQTELARTSTDADGSFELAGSLRGPADRNADGSVRIEIMALAPDVVRYYLVNAHPPSNDEDDWSWSKRLSDPTIVKGGHSGLRASDIDDEALTGLTFTLEGGTSPGIDAASKGPSAAASEYSVLGDQMTKLDSTGAEQGLASAEADAREAELARACPTPGDIYWQSTSDTRERGVPVHFAYVANKTKNRFEYETTGSTSLSIAYTGAGKNYKGGLTGSSQNNTSAGVIGTKGGGSKHTVFLWKLKWQYRKEDKRCFNMGYPYKMGRSRWLPTRWTGGNWTSQDATTFPCTRYRVGSTADFWVQRNTSSTWNGWFGIGGVELSSRQQRGTRIKGTYVLRKGRGRMVLCGNDNFPVEASFAEEIRS